jgi:hypothetical protein
VLGLFRLARPASSAFLNTFCGKINRISAM